VVPAGQLSVGAVPALRAVLTVKLAAAVSSSPETALFGVESASATDEAVISAELETIVPLLAVTVAIIVRLTL
jgi:hypothetical protein